MQKLCTFFGNYDRMSEGHFTCADLHPTVRGSKSETNINSKMVLKSEQMYVILIIHWTKEALWIILCYIHNTSLPATSRRR